MQSRFLTRSLHASWLIAWACVGIVAGVMIVGVWGQSFFVSVAWLLTGTGMVLTALWRTQCWMILLALIGGLLIGLWRGSTTQVEQGVFDTLYDKKVTLQAKVLDDVGYDSRGRDIIRAGDIRINNTKLDGTIWVTTQHDDRVQRSDLVVLTGKMSQGFGGFIAAMHDADLQGIRRETPGDIALKVRNNFSSGVEKALEEPEASLGLGYLVGMRRGLPEELDGALQAAGLTHIVVASGYNLTILVRLARRLFERISKYLSLLAAGSLITSFILITGMSPSMSRAGLVAGLGLLAWYYGRRFHSLVLLPLAMAVTLLLQPRYAWGDVAWQLSFAAFGGVMLLAPLMYAYFFADKAEHSLRRIFIETVAAQLCTLPILLVTYGSFSLVAPLANMLILPLVPLAMVLTFAAGIAGLIVPGLAEMIGLPAQGVLTYMTQTAQLTGGLEWALQELPLTMFGAVGWYVALITAGIWMWRTTRLDLGKTSLVE